MCFLRKGAGIYMRQNTLGRTGLKVSAIAYGGVVSTMGHYGYYKYPGDGQQASDDYVEYALESEVNYFDVAPMYGDAQEKLGNSLKGVRDRITLACKTVYRDYDSAALKAVEWFDFDTVMFSSNWQMNMAVGYGNGIFQKARERDMGILGMKSMVERRFGPADYEARIRWLKSWCKPFVQSGTGFTGYASAEG